MWGKRLALGIAVVIVAPGAAWAEETVQLPVDGLLDGRPVSTLTGGGVVPWTVGIDKDDAYMTTAAAKSLHQTEPALPDDGRFAANAEHPDVTLHFSNAAPATNPQAHLQTAMGRFTVPVPAATYAKVFLFLTASYGDASLAIKMSYADGTSTMTTFTLPDWGTGKALPTNPPIFFNLIGGLHKWNKAGMSLDTPSHTITGVTLTPAGGRTLTAIEVDKTTAAPWLTFWGATGLATSAVGGGADGGAGDARAPADGAPDADAQAKDAGGMGDGAAGGTGSGGAVGTSGSGGVSGEAGTSGGGGVSGSAGTSGGAGASGSAGTSGGPGASGGIGAAGSVGGAGGSAPPQARSSGGCSIAGAREVTCLGLAFGFLVVIRRRPRPRV